jgi:serine/threonine-protein kinase
MVKILDFGIARVNEGDGILDAEHLKTRIGQVLGTPRYMSPEQALGQEIDGRSDLFSVGVVMYEMITGKKAFGGASAATLALQITNEDPESISSLAPGTSRGLQFIVNKLLAKKPDRRFASGRLLFDALARERASHATAEEELKSKRYLPLQVRVTAVMAAVTAAILALTVGTVVLRQDAAMRQMAITTGTAMTSFVANNAALNAADNATLPSDKQDWLPVQGFVQAAAADKNVLDLKVIDANGVIRSASDQANLGKPFAAPAGAGAERLSVSETADAAGRKGFRFIEPISYGGRTVGRVDLSVSDADLQATSALTHALLTMLALVVLGVVVGATYIVSRALARPLKRLKTALEDGAAGDLAFRISHNRTDEFGELFDAFNRFSGSMQDRLDHMEAIALPPEAAVERPSAPPAADALATDPTPSVFQTPPPAPEAANGPDAAQTPLEATASKAPRRRRPKLAAVDGSVLERSAPPSQDDDRTVIEKLNDQKAEH